MDRVVAIKVLGAQLAGGVGVTCRSSTAKVTGFGEYGESGGVLGLRSGDAHCVVSDVWFRVSL